MMPYLALAVGVALVLILILVFRANAFLALLTAAIAVSLLAPAEYSAGDDGTFALVGAVKRVAVALGNSVGGIGIVIAMAAIIGTCLTESGAADRIIQSFLKLFGQKRAPWALMSGGFVLSVPVFFDTVFYLLVPLARSLYRLTEKNYLLYLMAIAAGGAITHTLVPPTPGPLVMASQLEINLGTMIGVGALVALPAAIAGVGISVLIDRIAPIPFREVGSPSNPEVAADKDGPAERGKELPSLAMSLIPVLLPVALIAVNTAVESALKASGGDGMPQYVAVDVEGELSHVPMTKAAVTESTPLPEGVVYADLPEAFTSLQSAHAYTNIIGDPNLALFVSAVFSMWLLVIMRSPSLDELAARVEMSLSSAGVIILITAAGGAFGAMLKAAGVGAAIADAAEDAGGGGMTLLFIAYGIAALMKIAQGSSTTAMITVSGMFSGLVVGVTNDAGAAVTASEVLGFNPVYLATAIGAGSLFGSWMNDSGFWIFTKMGGLTERESLRSWTPMLAGLSVVSFGTTLILAKVLPLL